MKEDNRNDKILNNFQTIGPFVLEMGKNNNLDKNRMNSNVKQKTQLKIIFKD